MIFFIMAVHIKMAVYAKIYQQKYRKYYVNKCKRKKEEIFFSIYFLNDFAEFIQAAKHDDAK